MSSMSGRAGWKRARITTNRGARTIFTDIPTSGFHTPPVVPRSISPPVSPVCTTGASTTNRQLSPAGITHPGVPPPVIKPSLIVERITPPQITPSRSPLRFRARMIRSGETPLTREETSSRTIPIGFASQQRQCSVTHRRRPLGRTGGRIPVATRGWMGWVVICVIDIFFAGIFPY